MTRRGCLLQALLIILALVTYYPLRDNLPSLTDPQYDRLYGTQVLKRKSLAIKARLEAIYQNTSGKIVLINIKTLLKGQSWQKFCYLGGYSDIDYLQLNARFVRQQIRHHWNYNDEYQNSLLIVEDGIIIPVRLTLPIDGQHFRQCYSATEPFEFRRPLFSEINTSKAKTQIQFLYEPGPK